MTSEPESPWFDSEAGRAQVIRLLGDSGTPLELDVALRCQRFANVYNVPGTVHTRASRLIYGASPDNPPREIDQSISLYCEVELSNHVGIQLEVDVLVECKHRRGAEFFGFALPEGRRPGSAFLVGSHLAPSQLVQRIAALEPDFMRDEWISVLTMLTGKDGTLTRVEDENLIYKSAASLFDFIEFSLFEADLITMAGDATDTGGNVLTYNGTTWGSATNIDSTHSLNGIACPATTNCTAVDVTGNALTYKTTTATSQLIWDARGFLPQVIADTTNAYVYGPTGTPVEQINLATSTPTYLTYTPSNSAWVSTNQAGNQTGYWGYDAYGSLAYGATASPFGYSGQYQDSTTGLVNDRKRWYEPQTGGFTTFDPAFTQTDSAYTYADSDPVNNADPLGLCKSKAIDILNPWSGNNPVRCQVENHPNSLGTQILEANPAYHAVNAGYNAYQASQQPCSSNWTIAKDSAVAFGWAVATVATAAGAPEADEIPAAGTGAENGVTVYRGTSITSELQIQAETGQLMSDAARAGYVESGGSIEAAQAASEAAHASGIEAWGSEAAYAEAHTEFGTELSQIGPRSMISVTTDPAIAKLFAGPEGTVFSSVVDPSMLIPGGAGESEFLIPHMFGAS